MPHLAEGARQLPAAHLSIRGPWHDDGWRGTVCQRPCQNSACLILPRIREIKKDRDEDGLAGRPWSELTEEQLPACKSERGAIMAPFETTRSLIHPYFGSRSLSDLKESDL